MQLHESYTQKKPVQNAIGAATLPQGARFKSRCGNDDQAECEGPLTSDDVVELSRRRQQLSNDVETSLARIAELQLWIGKANTESNSSRGTLVRTDAQITAVKEHKNALQRVNTARAILSSVPMRHWQNLFSLRRPSLAVLAVVEAAFCLLGRRSRDLTNSESWEQIRSTKNLPRLLIKCEPSSVIDEDIQTLRQSNFESTWTYDRVVRVHPTMGPLHHWITTMLNAKAAVSSLADTRKEKSDFCVSASEVLDVAALMQELEEHAEFVQLAEDELGVIDSILEDVAREGVAHASSVFATSPSMETCSVSTHAPSDVTRQPSQAESTLLDATGGVEDVASVNDKKECKHLKYTAAEGPSSCTKETTPIIPRIRLEACSLERGGNDTFTHSVRARFDELRSSPRVKSPSLGRPVIALTVPSFTDAGRTPKGSPELFTTCGSARVLQERAKLLERVYELEDMLKEVCQRNPKAAEMQLMCDEMMALRRELMALREERNRLLEQTKRYSVYCKLSDVEGSDGCLERCTGDADSLMIRELEEQLQAAHVQIQQLKAACSSPTLNDSELVIKTCSESCVSPDVNSHGVSMLKQRLDESQKELEARQSALVTMEERLNQEMHAHKEAREMLLQTQAELASVWKRLEGVEYQLKLAHEERDNFSGVNGADVSVHSDTAFRGTLNGDAALHRELLQFRQREHENQQVIERLRMEIDTLKRRHMEERHRQKELRIARGEMLLRLEKTFGEAMRRQECDLQAIPEALMRARNEMERLSSKRC